jgi:hypothetical protein
MRDLFWVCLDNTVSRDLWLINVHSVVWNKSSDGIRGLITLMCVATVIKVRSNSEIDATILDSKQCNKVVYWGWIPALTKRTTTYYTRIMKILDFRVLLSINISLLMYFDTQKWTKLQAKSFHFFSLLRMRSLYWWRNPEYPEKTTDLLQVPDKLYHILLFWVHLAGRDSNSQR